ncbi:nucleoside monophosphate kinase [Allosphingosinicella deserti]|uniref:Adenylate kinase n=1 Tax=Allosphingosinicella deserti TaxID=2116704 RepID=A0A2P7QFC2_9SPHN|nr:nucleoside monophosphate kinase [Sphingomonas deserti]PSJ36626.1 hypothetical protein C7I55_24855 [Sphingomonas deserti]
MTLITLFGRPGAGKSTVGDLLAERHGFVHLALGKMLKDPAVLGEIGIDPDEMRAAIASGRTVTSERLYPWLNERLRAMPDIVVDGYPRGSNSAGPFAALVDSLPGRRAVVALHLDSPTDVTHPRLAKRGRADDDERIASRDDEFERVQLPLLQSLPLRTQLITVDASDITDTVIADVERALNSVGAMPRR